MACIFRPSKEAQKNIEKIKADHDLKTNSKALEYVLNNFGLIEKQLKATEKRRQHTESQLINIQRVLVIKEDSDRSYKKNDGRIVTK